jgi:hypothetical protein
MNAISECAAYMLIYEPMRMLCAKRGVLLFPRHFVNGAVHVWLTPEQTVKAILAGVETITAEEAQRRCETAFLLENRMN